MKSKIAEDLRLAGNAKFYHSITYSSIEDIKADIVGLIQDHGDKYSLADYIILFDQADYNLRVALVLGEQKQFDTLMKDVMSFDDKAFIKAEYEKLKVSDEAK